jgi:hypothetical protein
MEMRFSCQKGIIPARQAKDRTRELLCGVRVTIAERLSDRDGISGQDCRLASFARLANKSHISFASSGVATPALGSPALTC